ncbi:hypothetical protein O3M35_004811 [Rhynocoris fuscipes]|uniref:Uncharacterized protein n=1 Tax=Rhynocoris fuscipes TaxID=488301 RepID=A0AAW1DID9_9HEMI
MTTRCGTVTGAGLEARPRALTETDLASLCSILEISTMPRLSRVHRSLSKSSIQHVSSDIEVLLYLPTILVLYMFVSMAILKHDIRNFAHLIGEHMFLIQSADYGNPYEKLLQNPS